MNTYSVTGEHVPFSTRHRNSHTVKKFCVLFRPNECFWWQNNGRGIIASSLAWWGHMQLILTVGAH